MPEVFSKLDTTGVAVWHQSGQFELEETRNRYLQSGVQARIDPFIEAMNDAYAWADLVVCRSGAITVSEIAAAGLASILVPFPHAVDDHQTANARYLTDNGAGVLAPQASTDSNRMAEIIREILNSPERLASMASAAAELAIPDATERVAIHCLELANV